MIDAKQTGKKLKSMCERRGVSVSQIQQELHIGAFQSIYNWFAGKTLPSLDNFYALSKLLNVSMERLIVEEKAEIENVKCMLLDIQNDKNNEENYYKRLYQYTINLRSIAA